MKKNVLVLDDPKPTDGVGTEVTKPRTSGGGIDPGTPPGK